MRFGSASHRGGNGISGLGIVGPSPILGLRRGDGGKNNPSEAKFVKQLQLLLMKAGFPLPRFGADGDFGAETETALKAFQRSKGLTATGIVTANTASLLESAATTRPRGTAGGPQAANRQGFVRALAVGGAVTVGVLGLIILFGNKKKRR